MLRISQSGISGMDSGYFELEFSLIHRKNEFALPRFVSIGKRIIHCSLNFENRDVEAAFFYLSKYG
jgi:hypothetical protein